MDSTPRPLLGTRVDRVCLKGIPPDPKSASGFLAFGFRMPTGAGLTTTRVGALRSQSWSSTGRRFGDRLAGRSSVSCAMRSRISRLTVSSSTRFRTMTSRFLPSSVRNRKFRFACSQTWIPRSFAFMGS
jgi:hypothetical protein